MRKFKNIIQQLLFVFILSMTLGCSAETSGSESYLDIESVIETQYEDESATISEFSETEIIEAVSEQESTVEDFPTTEIGITEAINGTSELQVHYIDVGQGDATLIICNGEAMLIDAGDNSKGTTVQLYLQKQGVKSLKYMIGTHPDADHIGGMDVIITKFDCETIIMPDKASDTATYRDVIDAMKYKNYKNTLPIVGDTYTLGDASFTIVAPNKSYSDTNSCSVVILLTHGNNKFLFTGDAEFESESDILSNGINISSGVLKVGHHGSNTSTGKEFLKAVNPQYAVISCGKDNSYGHPHEETLMALKSAGVQVFRTDEQGSIVATSNGSNISWNTDPSTSWKAGAIAEKVESLSNSDQSSNIKTKPDNTTAINPTSDNKVSDKSTVEENKSAEVTTNAEPPKAESVQEYEPVSMPAPAPDPTPTPAPAGNYVLNTNTHKFHVPSCSSVNQIKASNRQDTTMSRDEIIALGYEPCKRCNP